MRVRIKEFKWNEPGSVIPGIRAWILDIARMNFMWCTENILVGVTLFLTSWITLHRDGFKYDISRRDSNDDCRKKDRASLIICKYRLSN